MEEKAVLGTALAAVSVFPGSTALLNVIFRRGLDMGSCPSCGACLHVDTGSILDFEKGLIPEPIFFCTSCGYDSEKPPAGIAEGSTSPRER